MGFLKPPKGIFRKNSFLKCNKKVPNGGFQKHRVGSIREGATRYNISGRNDHEVNVLGFFETLKMC